MFKRVVPWKILVAVGCGYEIIALYSPLPTITNLTHQAKDYHLSTRVLVWAGMGAAVWHFFVEGPALDVP
jgi:hypothetical protein